MPFCMLDRNYRLNHKYLYLVSKQINLLRARILFHMGQIPLLGGGRNTFIRGKFRGRAYTPLILFIRGICPLCPRLDTFPTLYLSFLRRGGKCKRLITKSMLLQRSMMYRIFLVYSKPIQ